jgi:hypothetical protein
MGKRAREMGEMGTVLPVSSHIFIMIRMNKNLILKKMLSFMRIRLIVNVI